MATLIAHGSHPIRWLAALAALALLALVAGSAPASAAGSTEYVTFWRGELRILAHQPNTTVSIYNVDTGTLLGTGAYSGENYATNPFTVANAGDAFKASTGTTTRHVRIVADKPVTVWTGSATTSTSNNPWASFIPAYDPLSTGNGSEVGTEFLGYVPEELYLFVQPGTGPTLAQVDDLATNTDADTDDTVTLPSFAAGDDGAELGTLFYTVVHDSLTIFPTQDGTTVTVTDLSDGDDSTTVTLANRDAVGDYDIFTTDTGLILPRTGVNIIPGAGGPMENDYVRISADKPVLVYVGPASSNLQEYADVAFSVPTGPDARIVYVFAQNGGAKDLKIFAFDSATQVSITSLARTSGFGTAAYHDFTIGGHIGPGGWSNGTVGGTVWWSSGVWSGELLRIESTKPITVMAGDYDSPYFGTYVPYVDSSLELAPVAIAAASVSGCTVSLDGSASFDQDTLGSAPDIVTYAWDFGDGNTGTGPVAAHTYATDGTYVITLTVTDNEGHQDTDYATVTVTGCTTPPLAIIAPLPISVCAGTALTFDGSGSTDTDPAGGLPGIVDYAWDFGDGSTGSGPTPSHIYAAPGLYLVTLTVTDNDGESASSGAVPVFVADCTEPPVAVLSVAPGPWCVDDAVALDGSDSFDADLIGPAPAIVSYAWDLGDGNTDSGAALTHAYGAAGTYVVTLTVTDNDGQQASVTGLVIVETCTIPATVDVKPGSEVNPLNLNGNGVVPIAVLGSAELDASLIDVSSVRAEADLDADGDIDDAPGGGPVHDGHLEDVNEDGVLDLVIHVREFELGIPLDMAALALVDIAVTGLLTDATPWAGADTVRVTPNNAASKGKGGKGPK
jgi:PKD repeat protein